LTPSLFIIVVKGLAAIVTQVVKKQLLDGIQVGKQDITMNMLQFADDTLFT